MLVLLTTLYGALRLFAWHWHFPTVAERILWRSCASLIAASGMFFGLYGVMVKLSDWLRDRLMSRNIPRVMRTATNKRLRFCESDTSHKLVGWVLRAMLVPYTLARLYIVIEAFVSLRSQPVDVYTTPDWTEWIPHL